MFQFNIREMTETELDKLLIDLYRERDRYVSVAFRYLQNEERAKDIFSESFSGMLEKKETLPDDPVKLRIYLMQAVKHKCYNELKHDAVIQAKWQNLYMINSRLLLDDTVTRRIVEKDMDRMLDDAGRKMNKMTLDIYISSRLEDMSHKEIAQMFGISANRVAKEIMKAAAIMEKIVKDYLKFIILFIISSRMF